MSQTTLQRNISRLMALLLSILLILPCVPVVRADGEGGSCGDNLTWSLNAGTLTISGSGAMTDYAENAMAPWYSLREEILRLELPAGLTKIGSYAFYECNNLLTLTIPDSVESIADFAFTACEKIEYMTMGSSVRFIGQYAFSECYSLKTLQLPTALISIGEKAFYRCESISSVIVPASVTSLGMLTFGYCKSLVFADIRANIKFLPEFLFYACNSLASVSLPDSITGMGSYVFEGCSQLNLIHYDGDDYSAEQMKETVNKSVPQFETEGTISDNQPTGITNVEISKTDESGTIVKENITVVQGEDNSISFVVESTDNNTNIDFSITIKSEEDWEAAEEYIDTTLNDITIPDSISVNIYLENNSQVNTTFVEKVTEKGAVITVIAQNGSVWKISGSPSEEVTGNYDLRYTLVEGTEELTTELGGNASFVLKFAESAKVNAEVLIRLGNTWSNQGATLFQREKNGVSRIQAALVDQDGYAHFYLATVDKDTEYYIGMNIPADNQENVPIVPEEMLSSYGNIENIQPIQYEITGRKSSWNMGLGKVMAILAAVMVSAVAVVGAVMFFWNKQRLKNGYVPNWDDDEA